MRIQTTLAAVLAGLATLGSAQAADFYERDGTP